jgi:maltose O-acetyltransferase
MTAGMRRNPFRPRYDYVRSPTWAFLVNTVAASGVVPARWRTAIYRWCGMELETEHLSPGCYIHHADLWMGEGAILNHGVHIENVARVEIGPRTGLGVGTLVLTSTHDIGPHHARLGDWHYLPVTIGAGCWIAARSVILPGVTIGDGCIVAAGAVVVEDCEPDGLYAGVPARRIRDL